MLIEPTHIMPPPPLAPRQHAFRAREAGLFLHFGINTFNDTEWSDGSLPAASFQPAAVDADDWCRAARDAGLAYLCLTTKHHDGFCLWPTDHGDYGVRQAGAPDVIEALAAAADRHGLGVGLYYSLWDRCHPAYPDDQAYRAVMLRHLEELLTRYGPIVEVWFDGAWDKHPGGDRHHGFTEPDRATLAEAWTSTGWRRWGWPELVERIRSWQPEAAILNNPTTRFPGFPLWPVDARVCEGGEDQTEDQPVWRIGDQSVTLPGQIATTLSRKGPPGFFEGGSWFWHDWDDSSVTAEDLVAWFRRARGLQRNLLINAPVGPDSRIGRPHREVLATFGARSRR
ncbi:MAG: alpha-L-fucosidase [Opitutales bacterium]